MRQHLLCNRVAAGALESQHSPRPGREIEPVKTARARDSLAVEARRCRLSLRPRILGRLARFVDVSGTSLSHRVIMGRPRASDNACRSLARAVLRSSDDRQQMAPGSASYFLFLKYRLIRRICNSLLNISASPTRVGRGYAHRCAGEQVRARAQCAFGWDAACSPRPAATFDHPCRHPIVLSRFQQKATIAPDIAFPFAARRSSSRRRGRAESPFPVRPRRGL